MLTTTQLSAIAKEIIGGLGKISDSNKANADIDKEKKDLLAKQANFKLFYDKFNGIATAYETERRWLDGTTYTTIPWSQIDDAAKRTPGNAHFSGSWDKFTPQITANINGNPTSTSANHENIVLNDTLQNNGLLALINMMQNGQSSGVANDTLTNIYTPGAATIDVNNGGQTIGKFLYIAGTLGNSALVLVTNVSGNTLTITELIPPTATIGIGGSVVENIPGFTNTQRNTLVSVTYQNILTNLSNKIITRVALWNTALSNQLAQLNANVEVNANNTTAKNNIQTAQSAITVWNALPNTGTLGTDSKFTDNNLTNLATAYNARNVQRPTRVSQMVSALGTATQLADGNISGTGTYTQRFKSISLMINSIDGVLFLYYGKDKLKSVNNQVVQNELGKLELFGTAVKTFPLRSNAVGTNIVTVQSASGLAINDKVLVIANGDLADINTTVTAINGNNITLANNIPVTYTITVKTNIVKAV